MFAYAVPSAVTASSFPYPQSWPHLRRGLRQGHQRADLALPDQVLPLSRLCATSEGPSRSRGWASSASALEPPTTCESAGYSVGSLVRVRGHCSGRPGPGNQPPVPARAARPGRSARGGLLRRDAGRHAVLRAFVSPTYAPIDDLPVFETLDRVLAGQLDGIRFVRMDVTPQSSQYAAVSLEEIDLGVRGSDRHRNGFLIAN